VTVSPLRIGVAELRRRPGNRSEVRRTVPLGDLAVSSARVAPDAEGVVDVTLEALSDGVTARGTVDVDWEGECRRCLELTSGRISAPIDEVFKDDPDEGETLPVRGDAIDLEPVVHDAVILALPLAPLCDADCAGPVPEEFPVTPGHEAGVADQDERAVDPRWSGLEALRFDSDPETG
jgi:uncharacterized protein